MTQTVKGAGRKKAARLAAKHDAKVGARKGAPILPRSSAQSPGLKPPPISKAQAFANEVEALGFTVTRIKNDDGSKTVSAEMNGYTIVISWTAEQKFFYDGTYLEHAGARSKLRNASEAKRVAGEIAACKIRPKSGRTKPAARSVNPPSAERAAPKLNAPKQQPTELGEDMWAGVPDEEVIARIRGAGILWPEVNGKMRRTRIEKTARHLTIDVSKSTGQRVLTFCDDDGFHCRPLAEITLL